MKILPVLGKFQSQGPMWNRTVVDSSVGAGATEENVLEMLLKAEKKKVKYLLLFLLS